MDLVKLATTRSNSYRPVDDGCPQTRAAISVVIPYYNGDVLDLTLSALTAANALNPSLREVIIVDDGSPHPLATRSIERWAADLITAGVDVIAATHEHNLGRPHARNTGIAFTSDSSSMLLFLDQDMLVDPVLLTEGAALLESNGPGAVVGFRTTVPRSSLDNASRTAIVDDWRIQTVVDHSTLDVTVDGSGDRTNLRQVRILDETNSFANLGVGLGQTIACWDLPSMVVSHSCLADRDLVLKVGGYPEWVEGWGCEDMALGLAMYAAGGLIMASSAVSTQIAHAPHSGSDDARWAEFRANHDRYRSWATRADVQPFDAVELRSRAELVYHSGAHLPICEAASGDQDQQQPKTVATARAHALAAMLSHCSETPKTRGKFTTDLQAGYLRERRTNDEQR